MRHLIVSSLTLLLIACGQPTDNTASEESSTSEMTLEKVLAAQPEGTQARYRYRNPRATLQFFGIEPGMTVVEVLPGGGWYSKILLPYLGTDGHLIGANYATQMWPNFPFANDEFMARMQSWTMDWTADAQTWRSEDAASVSAFVFEAMPSDLHGTADAVLFIRALHNLARFQDQPHLQRALTDAYRILKPGGIVGVVQHEARPDMPDAWADGSAGYLKQAFVIEQMRAAGFEFAGSSSVNENPADQPDTSDVVWRLPPTLRGADPADAGENGQAALEAIGESNRMTLKFLKPAG